MSLRGRCSHPPATSAEIFKQSTGAKNRVGIGLHSLAELVFRNRFLGFLKVYKFGLSRVSLDVGMEVRRRGTQDRRKLDVETWWEINVGSVLFVGAK